MDEKTIKSELVVQKYGGTSVGTIERIKSVAAHIARTVRQGEQVVAVISAMGNHTDELLGMAQAISKDPPRRELDMLLTAGERISMALMSIALNDLGHKAISLTGSQSGIITDTVHGNARIAKIGAFRIQENLAQGQVVIVAGFQGVSADTKEVTTLGRGGSDLSAIALAGALGARGCQLYKDVDGVYSADPRLVKSAKVIKQISWDAMTLMSWAGASVLHPRGAHLAANFNIPVEIRSSFNLEREGTFVSGRDNMERLVVQAITHKENMVLVKGQLSANADDVLAQLRMRLWHQGETPQVQTQMSRPDGLKFCWSMPKALSAESISFLAANGMSSSGASVEDCGIITVIGSGFWQSPETLDNLRKVLRDPILLDVKNNALTIAVKGTQVGDAVKSLHTSLIG
jgi:aspartate kinase